MVVSFSAGSLSAAAREGSPSPVAGQNFGATNDSANILATGSTAFRSVLAPTTTKQIAVSSGTVVAETDVTIPAGQLVSPDQSLDNIASERFVVSANGSSTLYKGDLNVTTTSDDFIAYNGRIVAQEGALIPGTSLTANVGVISGDAGSQQLSANGSHYAFRVALADGSAATATDVVVKNNVVVAATDLPIFSGATEIYDDAPFSTTFFINAVDNLGNYVVGGTTNGDVNKNAVLVYNNTSIVARENDAVDLDGNGVLDDGVFIDTFGNDDSFLTDDGRYFFVASLRDTAGAAVGNAFLSVNVAIPEPTTLGVVLGGAVLALTRRRSR
jgi:hypothetical protein